MNGQYLMSVDSVCSFIMEMIHNTRAIIFGGRVNNCASNNIVYIVNIINNTLVCYNIINTLPDNML